MKDTLQSAYKFKIDDLQRQIDSLKHTQVIDKLTYRATEQIEVINQVDSFYTNAFAMLAGGFVIVGIIVPILLHLYQESRFKNLNDQYAASIKESVENKIDEEIKKINKDFSEKHSELEKISVNIKKNITISMQFGLAISFLSQEKYIDAVEPLMATCSKWTKIVDKENAIRAVKLLGVVISNVSGEEFKESEKSLKIKGLNIDSIITKLEEIIEEPDDLKSVTEIKERIAAKRAEVGGD